MSKVTNRVLVSFMLAGCAGARPLPPYFQSGVEHPTYPKKRYFLAASAGDSPDSAAANARAAVAGQVQSQITSELSERSTALMSGGGQASESSSIEQRVQVKAEFGHAELIKVVEQTRGGDPDQPWALAALDRLDAARVLESELAPALDEFNRSADGALAAARERRLKALFAARTEVVDRYAKLLGTGIFPQLAVLRGAAHPAQSAARGKIDEVERAARDARGQLVGLIISRAGPGVPLGSVDETVQKAMVALGIKVETMNVDVSPEEPGELRNRAEAIVARVDVDSSAKMSDMGLGVFFAYTNARVRLFRPATSEVLADFTVGGPGTKAGHRDEQKAIANSIKYLVKELSTKLDAELQALK